MNQQIVEVLQAGASYTNAGSWPGWSAKTIRHPYTGVSRTAVELNELLSAHST